MDQYMLDPDGLPPLVPQGDEGVQSTNDDAASSKLSAVNRGYFQDDYLHFFVRKPTRRAPLINRGYFSRVYAVRHMLKLFLQSIRQSAKYKDSPIQIVSLGAGIDTTYFWMQDLCTDVIYFEVDFPEVLAKKCATIMRHEALWKKMGKSVDAISYGTVPYISTPSYRTVAADMRSPHDLRNAVEEQKFNPTLPTLFLGECVLVYMETEHSDAVIQWASNCTDSPSAFVVYEQVNPSDAFGRTMVVNLKARGCPLLGLGKYPSIASQVKRYEGCGWGKVSIKDMNHVYDHLICEEERKRVQTLEIFDEIEEWLLIQAHYILVIATNTGSNTTEDQLMSMHHAILQ